MTRGVDHRDIVKMKRDIQRKDIAVGKDDTIRLKINLLPKPKLNNIVLPIPIARGVDHRNVQLESRKQESHSKANSQFTKSNFRTIDDRSSNSGYLKSIS